MKALTICLLFLSTVTGATNGKRGALLCDIENRKVSIFINSIYEDAETVCKEFNLPLGLLIAQACLESGYGTSYIAKNRCNTLGIKKNHEYVDYPNQLECFRHWARTVTQPCYKELECTSLNLWLYQLDHCGYHQSKNYSKKIRWIYYKYNLNNLDNFKN